MRYQIPQFIQREIRVVGPFSFRQSLLIGAGLFTCFILWISLPSKYMLLFLALCTMVMFISLTLAIGKFQGRSIANLTGKFFNYVLKRRTYLWKKKAFVPKVFTPIKIEEMKPEKKPTLTPKRGQLENLSSQLETMLEDRIE